MIIFADITARGRIDGFGAVAELSRNGTPPATHCYVECDFNPTTLDLRDGLVRVFDGEPEPILKASLLKPLPDQPIKVKLKEVDPYHAMPPPPAPQIVERVIERVGPVYLSEEQIDHLVDKLKSAIPAPPEPVVKPTLKETLRAWWDRLLARLKKFRRDA